jgi:hypothetical protein
VGKTLQVYYPQRMRCQGCERQMSEGEPAYRLAVGYSGKWHDRFGGSIGSICESCATNLPLPPQWAQVPGALIAVGPRSSTKSRTRGRGATSAVGNVGRRLIMRDVGAARSQRLVTPAACNSPRNAKTRSTARRNASSGHSGSENPAPAGEAMSARRDRAHWRLD